MGCYNVAKVGPNTIHRQWFDFAERFPSHSGFLPPQHVTQGKWQCHLISQNVTAMKMPHSALQFSARLHAILARCLYCIQTLKWLNDLLKRICLEQDISFWNLPFKCIRKFIVHSCVDFFYLCDDRMSKCIDLTGETLTFTKTSILF